MVWLWCPVTQFLGDMGVSLGYSSGVSGYCKTGAGRLPIPLNLHYFGYNWKLQDVMVDGQDSSDS